MPYLRLTRVALCAVGVELALEGASMGQTSVVVGVTGADDNRFLAHSSESFMFRSRSSTPSNTFAATTNHERLAFRKAIDIASATPGTESLLWKILPPGFSATSLDPDGDIVRLVQAVRKVEALSGGAAFAGVAKAITDATGDLVAVKSGSRVLMAFGLSCPETAPIGPRGTHQPVTPKAWWHATAAFAALFLDEEPASMKDGSKPVYEATTGGKALLGTFVAGGEVTQEGLNALDRMAQAILAGADPTAPELPGTKGRAAASTPASVGGIGIRVPGAEAPTRKERLAEIRSAITGEPVPTKAGAAASAPTAAAQAVLTVTAVKVKGADGVVETTGDAVAIVAAIDAAVAQGLPWAVFTASGPILPAERGAAVDALRKSLPPSEDDFFAV